ncbi:hypothetical protein SZ30_12855 [Burkholderia pseudomallei]|nr:hypothetical protein SZ30_12855 [Burkholderia pseudomallei]
MKLCRAPARFAIECLCLLDYCVAVPSLHLLTVWIVTICKVQVRNLDTNLTLPIDDDIGLVAIEDFPDRQFESACEHFEHAFFLLLLLLVLVGAPNHSSLYSVSVVHPM